VLGNVVSSGIKVLVLAVIVGIGSGLFAEFQVQPAEPSIDHALVVMLASLTLLALGIFGPGIATGLVSGGRSSARARWPVLRWARPALPLPSALRPRASAARGRRGAHGPGRQAGRQRCACRHSAASSAKSAFQAGSAAAAASRALPLAWAMSPRPARRRPGRRWPMARAR
jgi:type IV secretion system protein TrbL